MFEIYQTGREEFFQWDINQRIVIDAPVGTQVQFERAGEASAAVLLTYELDGVIVADVPNILLQKAVPFRAWLMETKADMTATRRERIYHVRARQKPGDYVYEETEVHSWQELEERVRALEEGGVGGGAVDSVNGKTGAVVLTAEDVGALPEDTQIPSVAGLASEEYVRRQIAEIPQPVETDPTVPAWAKTPSKPTYTAAEVGALPVDTPIPSVEGLASEQYVTETLKGYQEKGDYALKSELPAVPVQSVNGKTGAVKLTASDVGAVATESDPTVPAWAKAPSKPTYSAGEVGLGNVANERQYSASNQPPYPVTSVNGKTGAVALTAEDVGAVETESDPTVPAWAKSPSKPTYSAGEVGADPAGTAAGAVSGHNVNNAAHNDIRLLISGLTERLNALADSDDTTLDQMSEVVAYIKSNKDLIDAITTNKVSYSDIVNNLTTNVAGKPLSAAQGVALKALIDAITVPTKLSELANDKGYLTSYTESDPTVPAWAKAPSKPTYTKSEVGLTNVVNVRQYSVENPPPYPVTSVNMLTGAVQLEIPEELSDLMEDSSHRLVTDKEKAAWNGKSDFSGSYNDLTDKPTIPTVPVKSVNDKTGAVTLTAADVGAVPTTSTLTVTGVDADGVTHTWTVYGVSG